MKIKRRALAAMLIGSIGLAKVQAQEPVPADIFLNPRFGLPALVPEVVQDALVEELAAARKEASQAAEPIDPIAEFMAVSSPEINDAVNTDAETPAAVVESHESDVRTPPIVSPEVIAESTAPAIAQPTSPGSRTEKKVRRARILHRSPNPESNHAFRNSNGNRSDATDCSKQ